ncbi:MAG TPA: hypothetical protein VGJ82_03220 [Thermoanaerobaculia bacterium]|jgi:hypothetical protein
MKHAALLPLLLLAAYCTSGTGGAQSATALPGHGAITVQVAPNPIVAQPVTGTLYDFPFDVIVRETGGHPVTIDRVTADVTAAGGIHVAQDTYDAAKINSLNYPTPSPRTASGATTSRRGAPSRTNGCSPASPPS